MTKASIKYTDLSRIHCRLKKRTISSKYLVGKLKEEAKTFKVKGWGYSDCIVNRVFIHYSSMFWAIFQKTWHDSGRCLC